MDSQLFHPRPKRWPLLLLGGLTGLYLILYLTGYIWSPARNIKYIAELKYFFYTDHMDLGYLGGSHYDQVNAQVISENFYHDGLTFGVQNRKGNPKAGGWHLGTNCPATGPRIAIEGFNGFPYERKIGPVYGYLSDCYYLHQPPLSDVMNFGLYSFLGVKSIELRKGFYFLFSLLTLGLSFVVLTSFFSIPISLAAIVIFISSPLYEFWCDQPVYLNQQYFLLILSVIVQLKYRHKGDWIQFVLFTLQCWNSFEFVVIHSLVLLTFHRDRIVRYSLFFAGIFIMSLATQLALKTQVLPLSFISNDFLEALTSRGHASLPDSIHNLGRYFLALYDILAKNFLWLPLLLLLPFLTVSSLRQRRPQLYLLFSISFFAPLILHFILLRTAVLHAYMYAYHFNLFLMLSSALLLSLPRAKRWQVVVFLAFMCVLIPQRAIHLYALIVDRYETFTTRNLLIGNQHLLDINYWHEQITPRQIQRSPHGIDLSFLIDGVFPHKNALSNTSKAVTIPDYSENGATYFDLYLYNLKERLNVALVVENTDIENLVVNCRLLTLNKADGTFSPVQTSTKVMNKMGGIELDHLRFIQFSTTHNVEAVYRLGCSHHQEFKVYELFLIYI